MKCQGVLSDDEEKQVIEIAFPAGLVMGITPSTNPTNKDFARDVHAFPD